MDPRVVYEDEHLLVVDKPSGIVVDRAVTTKNIETLQDWAEERHGARVMRGGIVHRLDKETSGLLVIAKTRTAYENLQTQFKERQVKKKYIALVHGKIKDEKGVISASVGRLPWNRERFGVYTGGKEAETEYKVVRRFGEYTLLELTPKTGRTHQIRVHLKSIGHPVVSDEFYAGRKTARGDRKWCPRLFLHAAGIEFTHPVSGRIVKLELGLPEELEKALEML